MKSILDDKIASVLGLDSLARTGEVSSIAQARVEIQSNLAAAREISHQGHDLAIIHRVALELKKSSNLAMAEKLLQASLEILYYRRPRSSMIYVRGKPRIHY